MENGSWWAKREPSNDQGEGFNPLRPPSSIKLLLKKCERRKKLQNNWVEGTPNPGLLEDFLSVNQFQLYHVVYVSV